MDLDQGTVVDRYTVQSVLGEGGMAVVYLCRHNQLGTMHALKVLTMSSRAIRERLVQEGRVQAMLRHPNIVAVTDIITLNGAPGLVMEFIEGPSLDELLEQKPLSYEQADVLAEGILDGVAHAHAQGLVHRDLKPANIMLSLEGSSLVPKVTDFGLAKLLEGDTGRAATRTGSTMGTPHYMSPEQVSDSKNVDHRTDVFAMGAILYELVTGQRAFGGENLLQIFSAVAQAKFTPPRDLRPDLPERMESAILGAMEPDKEKRIQSVAELRAVWTGKAAHAGGAEPTAPAGPFSAEFLSSVSQAKSQAPGGEQVPSAMTWAGDSDISIANPEISVETLHTGPAVEGKAAPAAAPVAKKAPKNEVPAESMVSGTKLVVGGGAAFLFAAIGGGALLLLGVIGIGFALFATGGDDGRVARPDPAPTVEPAEPDPVAVVEPGEPDPTPNPQPVRPTRPQPGPTQPVVVEPTQPEPTEPEPTEPEPTEPEPTEPEPAEPEPAAAAGVDNPLLSDPDPKKRMQGVRAIANDVNASSTLVNIANNDDNREVQIEAWRMIVRRYKNGYGDMAAQEVVILDALNTGVFSRKEAATAYGARGTDVEVLVTPLSQMKALGKAAAVDAVVAVGIRSNKRDRAREILENEKSNVGGLAGKYIDKALQKL